MIVPAYNEQERLPRMLDEAIEFLEARSSGHKSSNSNHHHQQGDQTHKTIYKAGPFTYEIIVVDDGSTDETTKTVLKYSRKYGKKKIRVLKLDKNRGKGGAVRLGVLEARGQYVMFVDADGASKFSDVEKLENFIWNELSNNNNNNELQDNETRLLVAIGSRAHMEKEAIATRSLFRTILMKGFHFLVWFTCVRTVRDTQCGFKLFNRPAARVLFQSYHNESWAFDVELLFLAERIGCDIGEVPIRWTEVDGSKIVPVFSWLRMGFDVLCIAFNYLVGIYRVPSNQQVKLAIESDQTRSQRKNLRESKVT